MDCNEVKICQRRGQLPRASQIASDRRGVVARGIPAVADPIASTNHPLTASKQIKFERNKFGTSGRI